MRHKKMLATQNMLEKNKGDAPGGGGAPPELYADPREEV